MYFLRFSFEFGLMAPISFVRSSNTWNSSEPSLFWQQFARTPNQSEIKEILKYIFIVIYMTWRVFRSLPALRTGEKACLDPSESLVLVAARASCPSSRDDDVTGVRSPAASVSFHRERKTKQNKTNDYCRWLFLWCDDAFELSLWDREGAALLK